MRRHEWLLLVAAVASLTTPSVSRAFFFVLPPFVFDAERFLRRVESVANQVQQIEQLGVQLENDARLLAHTDVSTLAGMRLGLDRLRTTLSTLDRMTPAEAGTDFDMRYPVNWRGTPDEAVRFKTVRNAWIVAERAVLADERAVHNAVASDMTSASDRVGRLVDASGTATGLTAALQVRTQLNAELSTELAKWQTLRDARATARAERDGALASKTAYAEATARWLARPGTVSPVPNGVRGFAVTAVPEAGTGATP